MKIYFVFWACHKRLLAGNPSGTVLTVPLFENIRPPAARKAGVDLVVGKERAVFALDGAGLRGQVESARLRKRIKRVGRTVPPAKLPHGSDAACGLHAAHEARHGTAAQNAGLLGVLQQLLIE